MTARLGRSAQARQVLQGTVKAAAAVADRVRRPPAGLVTLIYHRVGATTAMTSVDLPRALFAEQVAWLADRRRATSIDAGLDALAAPDPTAATGSVVLTFDDGTADWVDEVLPVLVEHQVPATFYVATDFVARSREFPLGGRPISWAGLREMASTGLATIGSHTHRHALLDRLPPTGIADELDRSIELIGSEVGVEARHFAYPKALPPSPAADRAVRARFRSAALAGSHANVPGRTDPHLLARSPVQLADGMRWFEHKADGGLRLEEDLRDLLNRVRYRGATT